MSNIVSIKSLDEYIKYLGSQGWTYPLEQNWWLDSTSTPIGQTVFSRAICTEMGLPDALQNVDDYRSVSTNETNYWVHREAMRFGLGGMYKPCVQLARVLRHMPYEVRSKFASHMVHMSVCGDAQMIAYTPSHIYGLADRQVKMKLGRYLNKFYADVLTAEQIRNCANNTNTSTILWAYGSEAIRSVYENGPTSCMTSCGTQGDDWHPVEAYGYQNPDDGSYQLGVAYLEAFDKISARALVDVKNRVFVRCYGDDGPILESKLEDAGYEHVGGMGGYGIRLIYKSYGSEEYCPYLDGNDDDIDGPFRDSKGVQYWSWVERNGDRKGDQSDGVLERSGVECDDCDARVDDDDTRTTYDDRTICSCCARNGYTHGVYDRHGSEAYIPDSDTVRTGCGDIFLDRTSVLEANGVIRDVHGDYRYTHDCTQLRNGDWVDSDDDDLVCLYDGSYMMEDDRNLVTLIDGEYADYTDDDVVSLEGEGHGEWALTSDSNVVELDNGDWYKKDDSDIFEYADNQWCLKDELEPDEQPQSEAEGVAA